MTLSYTLHLRLAVPDFLSEPWHGEFAQAMDSIDQAIFNALIAANTSVWLNSHAYTVGQIVIDPQTGVLYTVAIAHTTAATPTTFAAFLAANPTFYSSFTLALASQAEAEAGVENTKYMSALRVAQAIAAQSPIPGIASQAQAVAGTNNTTMMTPLRTAQSIAVRVGVVPQGRLTLTAGTPVLNASVASTANIFYSPYTGMLVPLYNGTTFDVTDILDELPALTTDTAKNPAAIGVSKVNDWFIWPDTATVTISIAAPGVISYVAHGFAIGQPIQLTTTGALPTGLTTDTTYYVLAAGFGANSFQLGLTNGGAAINTSGTQSGVHTIVARRLTHGPDWTSDVSRSAGTALVMVKGIRLNSVAITNGPGASRGTYVGTTRSNAASQFQWTFGANSAGATAAFFSLWNAYNRRPVSTSVGDTANSWTYAVLTTWRAANANNNFRVTGVRGLDEDGVTAVYNAIGSVAAGISTTGIGLNSTSALAAGSSATLIVNSSTGVPLPCAFSGNPPVGVFFLQALEAVNSGGPATYFGTAGVFGVQTNLQALYHA